MTTVRISVAQMDCSLGDVEENLNRMEALERAAQKREAYVLCFPELATTGYSLNERWRKLAESVPGHTVDTLSRIADEFGFYLISGIVERDSISNRIFDSAVLIGPQGDVAGVYRKVHLWGAERGYFTPGTQFPIFKTRLGKIGIGICYDLEFPESARTMAMKGADLIFFASAEMKPLENHIDTYVRSRAAENCIFIGFSNRIGREGKTVFFGHSQIVSPTCRTLAETKVSQGLAVASLDFASLSKIRKEKFPYLKHRVPAAYTTLRANCREGLK